MHTPLHRICQHRCFWIPSMRVFEMQEAEKCGALAWCPTHTYLCTNYAITRVSRYLVWVCLKCIMPKKIGVSRSICVFKYLAWVCLKCTMPKMWGFDVAPQTHIPLYQIYQHQCFWIPSMGAFEMHDVENVGVWQALLLTLGPCIGAGVITGTLHHALVHALW